MSVGGLWTAILKALGGAWRWIARRSLTLFGAAAVLGVLLVAAVAAGVLAERRGYPDKAWRQITAMMEQHETEQTAEWHQAVLNQHTLEWAAVRIGPPSRGGGIAEIDGNVVFATPQGRINYLNRNNELGSLDLRTPMNLEVLRRAPVMEDPLFDISTVRTHDLFVRPAAEPGRYELYATFSRYVSDNCFNFVMARAQIAADGATLRPVSPDWEELFVARPGCIRYKDRSWRFVGDQAGGRMQMLNDHTMLISIGDHQFDGFNDSHNAPMDPAWDLGKIIAFDLNTRHSRIYARGLRNPQGLVVMRDGRIVETEHGPQGGDEINVIREGGNYGWPLVTYGMNYGFPRRTWLSDPTPGGHGGYDHPAIAFVPSVGIANLTQPSAHEFPLWADNDLILGSMRARTLFHVRIDGDRVGYTEPLPFGDYRLRDMITMNDGRIVILTDSGSLIFIRNADLHENEPREFNVTGLQSLPEDDALPADASPQERGRHFYGAACASCHSLDGEIGIGPPLNGVIGRRIGSVEGFGYSPALAGQDGVWTADALANFASDPQGRYPGTTMPPSTMSWTAMPDIAAFLRTTRASAPRRADDVE